MFKFSCSAIFKNTLLTTALLLISGLSGAENKDFRIEFENTKHHETPTEKRESIKYVDLFNSLKQDNRQYHSDKQVIAEGPTSISPLLPGMRIPDFSVVGMTGNQLNVNANTLQKPLVITFYRGGWCPYCNTHLSQLRLAEKELTTMGFDVWFISPDRVEMLYESLEDPNIGYTLLSDSSLHAAMAFGIAYEVKKDILDQYYNGGLVLEEASGEAHHYLPVPGTFIIGTDGLVHFQYVNPNYKKRLDPELLLAAAQSYLRQKK